MVYTIQYAKCMIMYSRQQKVCRKAGGRNNNQQYVLLSANIGLDRILFGF